MKRVVALGICLILSAPPAAVGATSFPIHDAGDAIRLAKGVCLEYGQSLLDEDMNETSIRKAMPTLKWEARLWNGVWDVDTIPSIEAGTNDHLLEVEIPVDGPAPTACPQVGYGGLLGLKLPPVKHGPCKPSDISEADAQSLALDATENTPGTMATRAVSKPDAWIVAIRKSQLREDDPAGAIATFRVFKRSAVAVNVRTGEAFLNLRSRAQFVYHHCLNGRR